MYEDKAAWDKDVAALKAREAGTGGGTVTPPTPGKVQQASQPNLSVPDNDPSGITDTITVNDEVLREITVPLSKATKRSLDCVLQLLVDDLLPFALKDAL